MELSTNTCLNCFFILKIILYKKANNSNKNKENGNIEMKRKKGFLKENLVISIIFFKDERFFDMEKNDSIKNEREKNRSKKGRKKLGE